MHCNWESSGSLSQACSGCPCTDNTELLSLKQTEKLIKITKSAVKFMDRLWHFRQSDLRVCSPTAYHLGRSRVCKPCAPAGAPHGPFCGQYERSTVICSQCRPQQSQNSRSCDDNARNSEPDTGDRHTLCNRMGILWRCCGWSYNSYFPTHTLCSVVCSQSIKYSNEFLP